MGLAAQYVAQQHPSDESSGLYSKSGKTQEENDASLTLNMLKIKPCKGDTADGGEPSAYRQTEFSINELPLKQKVMQAHRLESNISSTSITNNSLSEIDMAQVAASNSSSLFNDNGSFVSETVDRASFVSAPY